MKKIIDEELINHAIDLALPAIREIVAELTWGPKGVVIAVGCVGLDEPVVHVMKELGPEEEWEKLYEGKNFRIIALQKLSTALRGGNSSESVVRNHPWVLKKGDSFYTGAAAEDNSLAVSASGAYSETDETVSWIVWNIIRLLCLRRVAEFQKQGMTYL